MLTIDLDVVLQEADSQLRTLFLNAARAAGEVWQCRNSSCAMDNPRTGRLCTQCGRCTDGRPVGDLQPGCYATPTRLWNELRRSLRAWFAVSELPLPDAVSFQYFGSSSSCWSRADVTWHFGGRTETSQRFTEHDVHSALRRLTHAERPCYGESMRISLTLDA